uniref:Uncharacterized protein n=1 Tax=Anopheles culicifacies TaxID=139723 RepID=A0A182MK05_9DIPT
MIDFSAAEEEMDRVINSWGYTMNATDYMNSLRNRNPTANFASSAIGMGRGRGCIDVSRDSLNRVRLAAQINRNAAHTNPMGHLPTTEETLAKDVGPEITAGLRSIGILPTEDTLSSRTSRRTVPLCGEDVRIDRKVPVILNGEVFHARGHANNEYDEELPPQPKVEYDPSKPLKDQFTTIVEFQTQPPVETDEVKSTKQHQKTPPSKKGKKQKWTKVPLSSFMESQAKKEVLRPPVSVNSTYAGRTLFGIDGKQIL